MTWSSLAAAFGAPVFPIRIDWDGTKRKWQKRPLTRRGHKDASKDATIFDWSAANGFGIVMGNGWYALDLDEYKDDCAAERWLAERQVPVQTRTHQTVSNGRHLIYRTIGDWLNLRSRQSIVPGLDSRGDGGWIAFGEGYKILNNAGPAVLPETVCAELRRASGQGAKLGSIKGPGAGKPLGQTEPVMNVDALDVLRRLRLGLMFGRQSFRRRWNGGSAGLRDTSASGWDMSMAKLLANAGFHYSEIYWLLATQFQHGVVARDGRTKVTDRAIKRCAARATQHQGVISQRIREAFGHGHE